MSGRWDWDVKSSYTYHALKKAKDVVEKSLNQAAEEIQDSERKKSQNPPENGMPHQQPPYQAEGDRPGQAPSENFSGGYQPPPGRVYTTPPPQNNQTSGRKQTPPYQVYEPIKTKRQKKENSKKPVPPGMMEVRQKSVACYYGVGLFVLFWGLVAPIYRLSDFIIMLLLSVGVFFLCKLIFKGKRVFVPIPEKKVETGDREIDQLIIDGQNYLKKMQEADIAIEDETVSEQIRKLEEISKKIFEFVSENPKKAPQIRKFMNYYLPTTLKLLSSYDKLEDTGITGTNISETMLSIERMMNTIVMAFEKQLDHLFADEAMDISTDITVLEGMLAQEGLTGSDFNKAKHKGE